MMQRRGFDPVMVPDLDTARRFNRWPLRTKPSADPARLDIVEDWVESDHMWSRRTTLIMTLPWNKQNHPKPA
jgi:hypothetical protein